MAPMPAAERVASSLSTGAQPPGAAEGGDPGHAGGWLDGGAAEGNVGADGGAGIIGSGG